MLFDPLNDIETTVVTFIETHVMYAPDEPNRIFLRMVADDEILWFATHCGTLTFISDITKTDADIASVDDSFMALNDEKSAKMEAIFQTAAHCEITHEEKH